MADIHQLTRLLNETLTSDAEVVRNATHQLDLLSISPSFTFSLLSFLTGDGNQGVKVAAATYLKNLIRRNVFEGQTASFSKEFRNKLLESLLRAEVQILSVLLEAFRLVVDAEFVKNNSWPELVPELRYAIQSSDLLSENGNSQCLTLNALRAVQTLIRPFQYFLNPKVAKEPVPPQLEQISDEILVPLLSIFHNFAEKASAATVSLGIEAEQLLLVVCKCIYYAVRSYMPSSLAPLLPSFCHDLFGILDSLSLEEPVSSENCQQVRTKTAKRSLLMFCALVTRHRKYSDKLMPDIMKCVLRITRCSTNISKLDCLSERIISLAFDVISHVLETGPGWRLVSPHFSSLLNSCIMPALMLNEKDIMEWEEDADEFISKNLPSDLEEVSGWRDDLFTARKSAVNLLGVISMSKGPSVTSNDHGAASLLKRKKSDKKKGKGQSSSVGELLVLPFLSKFPIPSDNNASDSSILFSYFGVLMGYGALQDFLREQKPEYTKALIYNCILPLYKVSINLSYLIAAANWILGELASCLPEDMTTDVYSALLKGLTMPDCGDLSCYPVRASAAGAISKLLENEYLPPDWLPILQVIVGRIGDEEVEISMLFQLLSSVAETGEKEVAVHMPLVVSHLVDAIAKYMPANPEPWSQSVLQGFATLAVMAKSWQDAVPEDEHDHSSRKWAIDRTTIARSFSFLLQQAWIVPKVTSDDEDSSQQSCIDDASTLLWFIMRSVTGNDVFMEFKVSDLLSIWADFIADWHGWEEVEDLSIFDCIREVVSLQKSFKLKNFFMAKMPSPPAPPVPERSIIESIGAFVCEAITQYPSAASRACSCVHLLLHNPCYSFETEDVKKSLVVSFSQAVVSRFKDIQAKPCSMWKPLLLAISSCYLCYPNIVEATLERDISGGFVIWASALNSISSSSFTPNTSMESELKLVVISFVKLIEQLLIKGSTSSSLLWECFTSLLAALVRLKEVQEMTDEEQNHDTGNDDEDEDTDTDYDEDEDSDDEVHEETEEQFLERYAQAAAALEDETGVEEGDAEDHDEELELGALKEVDHQKILVSLLERYHQILIQKRSLPPLVISAFLASFPQYGVFFQ